MVLADHVYINRYTSAGGSYIYVPRQEENSILEEQAALGWHLYIDTVMNSI